MDQIRKGLRAHGINADGSPFNFPAAGQEGHDLRSFDIDGTEYWIDKTLLEQWVFGRGTYPRDIGFEEVSLSEGNEAAEEEFGPVLPLPHVLERSLATFFGASWMTRNSDLRLALYIVLTDGDSADDHRIPTSFEGIRSDLDFTPPYYVAWQASQQPPETFPLVRSLDFTIDVPFQLAELIESSTLDISFRSHRNPTQGDELLRYIRVEDTALDIPRS